MKKYMGKYTREQMSILIGMILGDGYVSKFKPKVINSVLACRHSKKQEEYLLYKRNRLNSLGFKVSKIYDTTNNYGETFTFECKDPLLFNQLRLVLYPKNNKCVKRKWLNWLTLEGLAIWFMDDGSYTRNSKTTGYVTLHTNGFNKKEHDIIIKYFKQVWNISPTMRIVKRKDRPETFFLFFNVKETEKLITLIEPYIIPIMKYKVGFNAKVKPFTQIKGL